MKASGTIFAIFSWILMALADNEQKNCEKIFNQFKIPIQSNNALLKDRNYISIPVDESKKNKMFLHLTSNANIKPIREAIKRKDSFKSPYSLMNSNIRAYVKTPLRSPALLPRKRTHKENYKHTVVPPLIESNFNKFSSMYSPLICNDQIPCVLTPIMLQILTVHVPPKPLPEIIYHRNPSIKHKVHIKPVLPTQCIYCYKQLRKDGSATNYELNRKGDVIVYETLEKHRMSPPYISEGNNKHFLVDGMNKVFYEHVNRKQYESSSVKVENNGVNSTGSKTILKKSNINNNKEEHEHATFILEDENKIKVKENLVALKPEISWKGDPIIVPDFSKHKHTQKTFNNPSTKLRGKNSNMESFKIEYVTNKHRPRGDIPEE